MALLVYAGSSLGGPSSYAVSGPGSYDPKLQTKGAPVTIKLRTATTMECEHAPDGSSVLLFDSPCSVGAVL